jgi:ferritin-like metal-binding protein YciE
MSKRIYVVEIGEREEQHLVEASSQAQAVRTVVDKEAIAAHVATQAELVALIKKGTEVLEGK